MPNGKPKSCTVPSTRNPVNPHSVLLWGSIRESGNNFGRVAAAGLGVRSLGFGAIKFRLGLQGSSACGLGFRVCLGFGLGF